MSFAKRLKSAIESKGLNIKEASELCRIPYRTLQNYLLEQREPNARNLLLIRTHLGVSIDWLLSGETPEPAPSQLREPNAVRYQTSERNQVLLDTFNGLTEQRQLESLAHLREKRSLQELEKSHQEILKSLKQLKSKP